MRPVVRYGLAFGLALILCLAITLPAGYALPALTRGLPGLAIAGVEGTLWSGEAQGVRYRQWQAERVHWSLRWLPLLAGRIEADWQSLGQGMEMAGRLGRSLGGDYYLTDIETDIGVKALQSMGVLKLPLPMNGRVKASIDELRSRDGALHTLSGEIDITDLQLETPLIDLGRYHIAIEPLQKGFQAILSDRAAALQAQGVALINPDGSYRFTGSFAARANAPEALTQSLRVFGNPGADGRIQATYNGKL